jgi:hypothetical protein
VTLHSHKWVFRSLNKIPGETSVRLAGAIFHFEGCSPSELCKIPSALARFAETASEFKPLCLSDGSTAAPHIY